MNWLDFEVKSSKVKVTARPHIVTKHFRRHFLICLQNALTYINETNQNDSLTVSHDTNIFKVMSLNVKVADNIFHKCTFPVDVYRSTDHCRRPFSSHSLCLGLSCKIQSITDISMGGAVSHKAVNRRRRWMAVNGMTCRQSCRGVFSEQF